MGKLLKHYDLVSARSLYLIGVAPFTSIDTFGYIWIHLASNNLVFFKVKAYDHKTDACLFTFCIQCLGGRGAALADQEHLVTIGGLVQPEGWLDPCLFGPQLNSYA